MAQVDPLAFPPFTRARRARADLAAGILRTGWPVPDRMFDEIYPQIIRRASAAHWSPVGVCARVVEMLRLEPGARLLDIGAGAGKFCIVAGAMSRMVVRGIEKQPHLATVAREAARRLAVDIDIADGTFEAEDPRGFDAVYLFNPFTETTPLPELARETPREPRGARGAEDVAAVEAFLDAAKVGMRVVTFCGFGGTLPAGYDRLQRETWDGGLLELWVKRSAETRAG